MEPVLFERIRNSLIEKRVGLAEWLRSAQQEEKEVALGPAAEDSLLAHMEIIDDAITKAEEGSLGLCEVCHESVEPELLEMDYTARVCLSHFSKQEIRNLENELGLAQEVQRMLLPQEVPDIPGLEVAAFTRPAQIVGGDYFDFLDFQDQGQGIAIADVAGHGVAASMHMASVQSLLRALVPGITSPAELAKKLNNLFIHNINYTTFVSLFISSLNPREKTLTYCNSGHNPPLLLRQGQVDEWLQPTGPAVGLVEGATFEEKSVPLNSGDLLLLYTDGVTEAINPQDDEFGAERLCDLVRQDSQLPAQELVQHLRIGLDAFTEGKALDDDLTIVLCKIL